MRWTFRQVSLLMTLLAMGNLVFAQKIYQVKTGDTLTTVLVQHRLFPIYGEKGSLNQVLSWNPEISDRNLIFPGQQIRLAAKEIETVTEAPATAIATETPPAPAPVEARSPSEDEPSYLQKSQIQFGLGTNYSRFDARDRSTNGPAAFISDQSPKLFLNWLLRWNETFSTRLGFATTYEKIQDDVSASGRQIASSSGTRNTSQAFGFYHWNDEAKTGFGVKNQDFLFERSLSTTTVQIERIAILSISLEHEQKILEIKKIDLSLGGSYDYLLTNNSASYGIDAGNYSQVFMKATHHLDQWALQGEINYGFGSQNTTLIDQKVTQFGFLLSGIWSLR